MQAPTFLDDDEIDELLTMGDAIDVVEVSIAAQAHGQLSHPPRFSIEVGDGSLSVSAGGVTDSRNVAGFRVYEKFSENGPNHDELTLVFDTDTGALKGGALGERVGPLRTGAIGGVAMKYMSHADADTIGVLGTGEQARTQLEAAVHLHDVSNVTVYSPTPEHRAEYVEEMESKLGETVTAVDSAEEAVRGSDVLIVATRSPSPVFEAEWLEPNAHVNTLGPRYRDEHEVPTELIDRSDVLVTDSFAQVDDLSRPFILEGTPDVDRLVELQELVASADPYRETDGISVFFSVGVTGTEVTVVDEALARREDG